MRCVIGRRQCAKCAERRASFGCTASPVPLSRAETADGAGDGGAGRLGRDRRASPWSERQPAILMATTVSAWRTGACERPGLWGVSFASDCGGIDRWAARAAGAGWRRGAKLGSDRHRDQWRTTSECVGSGGSRDTRCHPAEIFCLICNRMKDSYRDAQEHARALGWPQRGCAGRGRMIGFVHVEASIRPRSAGSNCSRRGHRQR